MAQRDEHPMDHIASMAGGVKDTVLQLESLARIMSSTSDPSESRLNVIAADFRRAMSLFTEELQAIRDGLEDIQATAEDAQQVLAIPS
jgi:hypothetical protein